MANKRWKDLSPRNRRLVLIISVVEGLLKTAALVDLARRLSEEVRGSKMSWAIAVFLIRSVPITYFAYGRRTTCRCRS